MQLGRESQNDIEMNSKSKRNFWLDNDVEIGFKSRDLTERELEATSFDVRTQFWDWFSRIFTIFYIAIGVFTSHNSKFKHLKNLIVKLEWDQIRHRFDSKLF